MIPDDAFLNGFNEANGGPVVNVVVIEANVAVVGAVCIVVTCAIQHGVENTDFHKAAEQLIVSNGIDKVRLGQIDWRIADHVLGVE